MDLVLSIVLAHLSGETMDVVANPMFPEDTRKKVEKLQKMDLPEALRGAVDAIPDIMAERALIIHGFSVLTMDNSEQFRIGLRGRYKARPQKVDAARVKAFLDGLSLVNGALFDFLRTEGLTAPEPDIPVGPFRP